MRERSIIEVFQASENKQVQDSTLPMNERAFRVEVLEDFLKAGIPVYKVDKLRPLLEERGYRLTHSTNLRQYIPLILKKEVDQLKREIPSPSCDHDTRYLSLIPDGSTKQVEAIVIIVRFLDDDWGIQQRLIKIDICEKAVNAEGLAHVLNERLSVDYGMRGNSLLAAMKDSASVNQAAMERIKFIFPMVFSVVCFSHTLDNVGNHFHILTLQEFGNLWICMFSHSHKAKLL